MKHLFAYGTLMCDDILRDVSGCGLSAAPAALQGYSRRAVRGEAYPGLVSDAGGRVEGLVYRDVPDAAWERLDRFEGDMYVRLGVRVELGEGASLDAEVYVVRPEFLDRLEPSEWDFQGFLRDLKESFESEYRGYEVLSRDPDAS